MIYVDYYRLKFELLLIFFKYSLNISKMNRKSKELLNFKGWSAHIHKYLIFSHRAIKNGR